MVLQTHNLLLPTHLKIQGVPSFEYFSFHNLTLIVVLIMFAMRSNTNTKTQEKTLEDRKYITSSDIDLSYCRNHKCPRRIKLSTAQGNLPYPLPNAAFKVIQQLCCSNHNRPKKNITNSNCFY